MASFVDDTADRTGRSKRAVSRDASIGEKLVPELKDAIREDLDIANNQSALSALASQPEEVQRKLVAAGPEALHQEQVSALGQEDDLAVGLVADLSVRTKFVRTNLEEVPPLGQARPVLQGSPDRLSDRSSRVRISDAVRLAQPSAFRTPPYGGPSATSVCPARSRIAPHPTTASTERQNFGTLRLSSAVATTSVRPCRSNWTPCASSSRRTRARWMFAASASSARVHTRGTRIRITSS